MNWSLCKTKSCRVALDTANCIYSIIKQTHAYRRKKNKIQQKLNVPNANVRHNPAAYKTHWIKHIFTNNNFHLYSPIITQGNIIVMSQYLHLYVYSVKKIWWIFCITTNHFIITPTAKKCSVKSHTQTVNTTWWKIKYEKRVFMILY